VSKALLDVGLQARLEKKFKGFKYGLACSVHKHRDFVPAEDHHIWPKEWHGPDTKENLTRVCSNGHGEIHYYLNLLLATGHSDPVVAVNSIPHHIRARFGPRVKAFGLKGFMGIMSAEVTNEGLSSVS
jgi:hypothetical protein